jgi:sugar phosphate permease
MDGLRGIAGWQWIFIVEGSVTVFIGVIMPFLIPDSPESSSWLDEEEKRFIDIRLRMSGVRHATQEGDRFSWKLLAQTMLDWKIFLGVFLGFANSVPNAAFSLTLPTIIKNLGFTTTKAQLLTIPPYFCGGISSYLVSRLSDRFVWRMPFIVGPLVGLVIALSVLYTLSADIANHIGPLYFAIILANISIYPLLPGFTAWVGNNLGSSWKRSIGLAWLLSAGNCGSAYI